MRSGSEPSESTFMLRSQMALASATTTEAMAPGMLVPLSAWTIAMRVVRPRREYWSVR